jgi:DNA-directed RNA polymerase specialized sigma24 family protein
VGGLSGCQPTHYSDLCQATPYDHNVENPLADIDQLEQIEDPAQRALEAGRRLNDVVDFQKRLRAIRQAAVLELRGQGMSYDQIGKALGGLHRNRVQQIAEGRSGGGKGGGQPPTE